MKITEYKIKRMIKEALLREDSMDAYARFVHNMERLALFSERSAVMKSYKNKNPEMYEKVKALGQKLIKKVQGDFPGKLDVDKINSIIRLAREEKRKNPSISYPETVVEYSKQLWSNNINRDISRAGTFTSADPRTRGEFAKSIDRTLKYAWKQEADQPENKRFWDNFEVWHAVGGIVGGGATGFDHDVLFQFLEAFKTSNPNELSGYGHSGKSDKKMLNPGINNIIRNTSIWHDNVHVRLDGEITFAANFDITTQWLSLKDEDTEEFEKAGDLTKLLKDNDLSGMITGPRDIQISGDDSYNEIVIKDSRATAIVFPQDFFDLIKKIGSLKIKLGNRGFNLFMLGREINKGNHDYVLKYLKKVDESGEFGSYYRKDTIKLFNAMLTGDVSILNSGNSVVEEVNIFKKYLDINMPFYDMGGANVTNRTIKAISNLKACVDFVSDTSVNRVSESIPRKEKPQDLPQPPSYQGEVYRYTPAGGPVLDGFLNPEEIYREIKKQPDIQHYVLDMKTNQWVNVEDVMPIPADLNYAPRKKIAETIRVNRKQLRKLIRKIL